MDVIDVCTDTDAGSNEEQRRGESSALADSLVLLPDDCEPRGPISAPGKLVIVSTSCLRCIPIPRVISFLPSRPTTISSASYPRACRWRLDVGVLALPSAMPIALTLPDS